MSEATLGPLRSSPLAALLRLLAIPLLACVAFVVSLGLGLPSSRVSMLIYALLAAVLTLSPIVIDTVLPRARRNLLLSLFSFSYSVHYVLPVFVFYLGGAPYDEVASGYPRILSPADVTRGLFAALLGFAMILIGYALPIGRIGADALPRMRREWSEHTALVVALVMIPLGWSVILAGQLQLIPKRAGTGVLGAIASASYYGIGLLAICYFRYRSVPALALVCLLTPPTMAFNFFTGSKILFLMPLVMLAIVHVLITRQLRLWWIAGFLAIMVLFYPVSEVYRNYFFHNRLSALEVITNPGKVLGLMRHFVDTAETDDYLRGGLWSTAARLNALDITSVIVRDAGRRVPFQEGRTLVYVPMAYIPRIIWADKPSLSIGQWVTDHFGSGPEIRSSTGPSWIGEFYFNFGWAGVVIGMALMGVWMRLLQESFLRMDATIPMLLAGVVSILVIPPQVEAELLGPINSIVFQVTPIFLTHLVVRTFTAPPDRLPPPMG